MSDVTRRVFLKDLFSYTMAGAFAGGTLATCKDMYLGGNDKFVKNFEQQNAEVTPADTGRAVGSNMIKNMGIGAGIGAAAGAVGAYTVKMFPQIKEL